MSVKGGRFGIICPIKGQGRINAGGPAPALKIRPGRAVLISAGGPFSIVSRSSLSALILSVPAGSFDRQPASRPGKTSESGRPETGF
jgi:hypothetical protein